MSTKNGVFVIQACRCKRCGGLLTSAQGLRDGYGPCCLRKIKQEEAEREMAKMQVTFFDLEKEDQDETTHKQD